MKRRVAFYYKAATGGGGGVGNVLPMFEFLIWFSIGLRWLNFVNMPFQVLKAWNIVYKNMKSKNPSRCSLPPHLKWRYFSNLGSRTTLYYASCKRRPNLHWMTASKNRSKCESPRCIRSKQRFRRRLATGSLLVTLYEEERRSNKPKYLHNKTCLKLTQN